MKSLILMMDDLKQCTDESQIKEFEDFVNFRLHSGHLKYEIYVKLMSHAEEARRKLCLQN